MVNYDEALRNFNTLNDALRLATLAEIRRLQELESRGKARPYMLRRLRQRRRALLAAAEERQAEEGDDE